MFDVQGQVFRWMAYQPLMTGVAVLAVGLLYGFQGFRFARVLIPASCTAIAYYLGCDLASSTPFQPMAIGIGAAVVTAVVCLSWYQLALIMAGGSTMGALLYYLAFQCGTRSWLLLVFLGAGTLFGLACIQVCRRTLPIYLTTLQGSALMLAGFVGVASSMAPALGATFREWSAQIGLLVPAMMVMLFVMTHSYQSNARQGDMVSGATKLMGGTE